MSRVLDQADADRFHEAALRFTATLQDGTPEMALALLVRLGFCNPDGSLHEDYGGEKILIDSEDQKD